MKKEANLNFDFMTILIATLHFLGEDLLPCFPRASFVKGAQDDLMTVDRKYTCAVGRKCSVAPWPRAPDLEPHSPRSLTALTFNKCVIHSENTLHL